MKNKISFYKWHNRIEEITPKNHRIGTDILLIKDANAIRAERANNSHPFKIDMSMAIIYDCGEAVFKINMRPYHIKAPSVIIIMHGQTCELISFSDDLQGRAIAMSSSFTDSLFTGNNGSQTHNLYSSMLKNPLINFEKDQNIFGEYYQLLLNIAQSPNSDFKVEAARHLTLAMFYGYSHMKHEVNTYCKKRSRKEEIYLNFLEIVADNYKEKREVSFYADKLCITPKHLSQVIKDVSGKTALDIIEEYVIPEIKALLLSSTMTIQQISDQLNFPSQSVFGKFVKRIIGVSPKTYRKNSFQTSIFANHLSD